VKGTPAIRSALLFCLLLTIAAVALWSRWPSAAATNVKRVDNKTTPAGRLISDATTGLPAVAPLTMNFVRSPDATGPDGKGRYLIGVNSGYGIEFNSKSKPQQTLSIIDLNKKPEPQVVQNLYFPAPQSANVGIAFDPRVQSNGKYRFYVSGGFENKIWTFALDPTAAVPVAPANRLDEPIKAPFIDVSGLTLFAPSSSYNDDRSPVYPVGIALSPDGESIYTADNLGDTLGVVSDLRGTRRLTRIQLAHTNSNQFVYPYDVKLFTVGSRLAKAYVSLWGDGSIAVVNLARGNTVSYITVGRHPTLMTMNRDASRLYVVNSDGDSVSVIDTRTDAVVETINLRLAENARGMTPEGIGLSNDEKTLYVTNAHANAVAVVQLAGSRARSKLLGFIPTGSYPSAIAVVGNRLFVANGKGTGMENSSLHVTETGLYPNMPNKEFPPATSKRGMYSVAIVSGNISMVDVPDEKQLFGYTQTVMRNSGLLGRQDRRIFPGGKSPFKHAIYIIRENRTYDQVLGDLSHGGDGSLADSDGSVAIFGAGKAAKSPNGEAQDITPNAHALALRFGLFDRFFVNAEASPDGHNWSTAAFSSDYIDKAFRWEYGGRGRGYDYEGANRLPSIGPATGQPPVVRPPALDLPASAEQILKFEKKYIPFYNGARDIGEPDTLYLWDAANRAGLTYRNYGEFIETVSADDVKEMNDQRSKTYPDVSSNAAAIPVKKTLEGHFAPQARNFDLNTPDILTTASYRASQTRTGLDPAIVNTNSEVPLRGNSRFNAWVDEFHQYVAELNSGKGDHLPNLSIVRLANDHTAGLHKDTPTPQFYVADNDYAVGRLVEEVSKSPFWADTAIFIVEDDAQDGADHVDAHRSPALVISAYNRPGAVIHEFHNTVSLIRTLELCIGLPTMNFLDANATPMDIFTTTPDLRPFQAQMPKVALDNLYPPDKPNAAMAYYMRLTSEQDLSRADMADPQAMNEIIWYSVTHESSIPGIARLPAFELMKQGIREEAKTQENERSAEE
jgi:YVTN family beta-propeller protein